MWLGDLPIATIQPDAKSSNKTLVYYVHPDHLGTPRAVSDPVSNKAVWRWESDAFGNSAPDEDPDQDKKKLVYNLRFPGQYFDQETGLNYNFFRDYEPATGRYIQSDPIGIKGGIGTYSYAFGSPLSYSDPHGLIPIDTIWDLGNLAYDIATGNWVDAAADAAALCTPYVPAGIPKLRKLKRPVNEKTSSAVKDVAKDGKALPDDALVCRGGTCTAEKFSGGSGVTLDSHGNLQGVSVNSGVGKTVEDLTVGIPNKQVGVTTVGKVREAGGNVIPSPTPNNPHHCTLCGITPAKAESLMTPTIRNPHK
ncbi:RHS repeat domain-containing protein [Chitinimonas lacunae]|uniref:RHS repeat domain-containing protein n=1 Tax=Chitinimonas lacunae TaxID=1963018 RepID=A0ABV8MTC0_9NEIS